MAGKPTAPPPDARLPDAAAASAEQEPLASGRRRKKLLDGAMADYYAGQYDLAALGLESYVKTFPQSTEAPEAQLRVGNSYLQLGKNDKAVEAYDVVDPHLRQEQCRCPRRTRRRAWR